MRISLNHLYNFKKVITAGLLLLVISSGAAQFIDERPVRVYELWDWVTYKYSNHPTSLSEGIEFVYIGTSGGIYAVHKYGNYWTEPHSVSNGLSDDFITAVLYDETTNYLWAAHRAGLSYLAPTAQFWINIPKTTLNLPQMNEITRLGTDGNAIWVEADGGYLFTVSKIMGYYQASHASAPGNVNWQVTAVSTPDMRGFTIDQNYFVDGRGLILDSELREYKVNLYYSDQSNDIFGGIDGLGLFEGDENIKILRLRQFGPLQNFINAAAYGDGRIWMAGTQADPTYGKVGISCVIPTDNQWNYFEDVLINELATYEVNDLAYANHRLWIGTNQGLSIYDQKKDRWKRLSMSNGLPDEIITTVALEDTIAWIGTPRGLCLVSMPQYQVRRIRLSPRQNILRIAKIAIDSRKIWIGTDNGLYSIDKFNRNIEHYDMFGQKIGLDDAVAAEYTAIGVGDSVVVFGRYHELLRYSKNSAAWSNIPLSSELNDADFFDIAIRGKYMWLGTSRGAHLIRLDDYYCEHYSTADGLAGNVVFKTIIDDERVWFATDAGLTKYNWSKYVTFVK